MGLTIGLPRMHKEARERRDFLPSLVSFLGRAGAEKIVVEEGYGSGIGCPIDAYTAAAERVRVDSYEECLQQDVVLVVRCPDDEAIAQMRWGALLISMLHYPTRPERVELLDRLAVRGVSLDGVVDDAGRRMVENLEAVGWNGVRESFRQIRRMHPHFDHPSRRPLRVTCLGSGAVGGHAVHAATRYGDPKLREELVEKNVPGVEVIVADFDLTWHEDYMLSRLERTDLLIDATQRLDPSRPVVPNPWVAALPEDAVILDLAVDPYDFRVTPPRVKGIEGVPHGDLDRYVFRPDDPAYDLIDPHVDTTNRRVALSCFSWPGLQPRECMELYGEQVEPVMEVILAKPVDEWDAVCGSHEERAVARAEVSRWRESRTT